MAILSSATLSSTLSSKSSSQAHLGSLQRGSQIITGRIVGVTNLNNARKGSFPSFTIKCLKGHDSSLPHVIDQIFNGGVTPTPIPDPTVVTRQDFPPDFLFGCSTSAFQTEGNGHEGGRGPATWDNFIQPKEKEDRNAIAVDSYNRYKEDVQQLVKMGVTAYRFSISWSRLLPDGTIAGGINQEGINFYSNFIDELRKYEITPIVTLFHFDLPTALENKYNGFLNSQIVDDFKAYANLCFQIFGNQVKYWTTINKPQTFAHGYEKPDQKNATDPYIAAHNIILAHASAAKLYKETYQAIQKGEVGISLLTRWFEPYEPRRLGRSDEEAAKRAFDFETGWLLEPLVHGDYPFIMKALVGDALPTFTDDQKTLIQGSYDFIGVNYYTSSYVNALPFLAPGETITSQHQFQRATLIPKNSEGKFIGQLAPGSKDIYVYPQGLKDALIYIGKTYGNPKIIITENGYPEKKDDKIPVQMALQDNDRIQHILSHLYAISEARKAGTNIKGYFMWALMDCMEMGSDYKVRYGLVYTDYHNNLARIPKKSSSWLYSFMNARDPHHPSKNEN